MVDQQPKNIPAPYSGSIYLRVIWMCVAAAIWLCLALKANAEPWTFGIYDLAIVVAVFAGIGARALDTLYFGGTTADSSPSTPAHVVRYAVILVLATAVAWVLAQSVAI